MIVKRLRINLNKTNSTHFLPAKPLQPETDTTDNITNCRLDFIPQITIGF